MGSAGICLIMTMASFAASGGTTDRAKVNSNLWQYLQILTQSEWGITAATFGTKAKGDGNAPTWTNVDATATGLTFSLSQTDATTEHKTANPTLVWYQPKPATSYSGLRRYSAKDKVKGYWIEESAAICDGGTGCTLTAG